jgi:hypothetical protein
MLWMNIAISSRMLWRDSATLSAPSRQPLPDESRVHGKNAAPAREAHDDLPQRSRLQRRPSA